MNSIGFGAKRPALSPAVSAAIISLSAFAPTFVAADPPPASNSIPASGSPAVPDNARQGAIDRNTDRHATRGDYLVRTALTYRGLPYRWGGTSPRSGFDCSGMVQFVCAKWGILLPRAARAQFKQGKPVKRSELQPGDLVFFKNTYRHGLSHVGIYVGEGLFIHASGQRTGVMLSHLDKGYHLNHWAGARRLDLSKLPSVPGEQPVVPSRVILEDARPIAPAEDAAEANLPDASTR